MVCTKHREIDWAPTFPAEQMIFAAWLQQQLNDSRLTGIELAERAHVSTIGVLLS
jgi:hypothetical protein